LVVWEEERSFALGNDTVSNTVLGDRPTVGAQTGGSGLLDQFIGSVLGDAVVDARLGVAPDGYVHARTGQEPLGSAEGDKIIGVAAHDEPPLALEVARPCHHVLVPGRVPDGIRCPRHSSIGRGDLGETWPRPGTHTIARLPDDNGLGSILSVVDAAIAVCAEILGHISN
jgi:hypothetical protein